MNLNIKELIQQMTLEEKAGLCSGNDSWTTKAVERLGIPSMRLSDGPHGLRRPASKPEGGYGPAVPATCFPTACALASSWDPELVKTVASAIADEAKGEGVGILLGPGVCMKRSPLCGRNFEYFSEDPYLAGVLGTSYVEGVQERGIGVSLKHFAVNNQETRRFTTSANLDERTLREIYLAAFEMIVKQAKPATIMESYNRINGENACQCDWLLNDILREEWGFDGFVMSDWNAVLDRVPSLKAGLDLEMPTSWGYRDAQICEAVRSGELEESVLDRACERILNIVFRYAVQTVEKADLDAHHALAGRVEAECMVLLKNDRSVLPLDTDKPLAVIGEFCEKPRFQGGGSSHINCYAVGPVLEALRAKNGEKTVYAKGYSLDGTENADALIREAVAAARSAGRAVIFAGLPDSAESEGWDRRHMRMPENQNRLIAAVTAAVPDVAVVLLAGAPVEMPWLSSVPALLHAYLGGENVAYAAAEVLFGDVNPSGHLAETMPLRLQDTPSYLNFPGDRDECCYGERIYIGYRWYEKTERAVAFPFGHGLSYTNFSISDARINGNTVTFRVKNIGDRAGKAVCQLYVGQDSPICDRPVKELKGFAKVALEPWEEKTVLLTLDDRSFAFYDTVCHAWRATSGTYTISIGFSSADIRAVLKTDILEKNPPKAPITRNSLIGDLVTDPAYHYAAEDVLRRIFSPDLAYEIEQFGFTMNVPRFKRWRGSALRQFIEYRRGELTEDDLAAILADAEKKRTE
ncbi:MAG: glycoside hydrolase family 3 C-terminal domain-containing protein [Eubacteriales bacterium]